MDVPRHRAFPRSPASVHRVRQAVRQRGAKVNRQAQVPEGDRAPDGFVLRRVQRIRRRGDGGGGGDESPRGRERRRRGRSRGSGALRRTVWVRKILR